MTVKETIQKMRELLGPNGEHWAVEGQWWHEGKHCILTVAGEAGNTAPVLRHLHGLLDVNTSITGFNDKCTWAEVDAFLAEAERTAPE